MKTKLTLLDKLQTPQRKGPGQQLIRWKACLGLAITVTAGHAQTFTTLKSFGILTNITGFNPRSTLVQGPDGALYGTASSGEGSVAGTVFKLQPDGSGFAVLKWFTNSLEGANPHAALALSGSVLYGSTVYGGSSDYGTVFKLNTDGTGYTVLKNFTGGEDGAFPYAGLELSGGVLYGTTIDVGWRSGAVFKMNTDGTGFTVLMHITRTDGAEGFAPRAWLTLSGSVLYGTTEQGGSSGYGTVFRLNTDGTGYTLLKDFTGGDDGPRPEAGLTLSGNVLYGTTQYGGSAGSGSDFKLNTDGTGCTMLKSFTGNDGSGPSGLALSGSVVYGTTFGGGSFDYGTVFQVNTDGTEYRVLRISVATTAMGCIPTEA